MPAIHKVPCGDVSIEQVTVTEIKPSNDGVQSSIVIQILKYRDGPVLEETHLRLTGGDEGFLDVCY